MDDILISSLAIIVNDIIKENISRIDAKSKINRLLHNKSNKTIINDLIHYTKQLKGKKKNIATLIVIVILLIRDLDSKQELISLIQKHEEKKDLQGYLFGGLTTLLVGDSEVLSLKINWNDVYFTNKLDFLCRFDDFKYFNFIEVLNAVEILASLDNEKFEKLAVNDTTKIILLNMLTCRVNIEPTANLIQKLLSSDDDLQKNIGWYFLTDEIPTKINALSSEKTSPEFKLEQKVLAKGIEKCLSNLEFYDKKTQTHLLYNFILSNPKRYPQMFARKLLSSELQNEFVEAIRCSHKIRTLQELYITTYIISTAPALNQYNRRISKLKFYNAITDIFIQLIKERKIPAINDSTLHSLIYICDHLPIACSRRLTTFLKKEQKTLMCTDLDRLLRSKIFFEDSNQCEIINNILKALNKRTKYN